MEKHAKQEIVSSITKYLEEANSRTRDYEKYKEYWDENHCTEGCLISETVWHASCFRCQKLMCSRHYNHKEKWSYNLEYYCPKCIDVVNAEDGQ